MRCRFTYNATTEGPCDELLQVTWVVHLWHQHDHPGFDWTNGVCLVPVTTPVCGQE